MYFNQKIILCLLCTRFSASYLEAVVNITNKATDLTELKIF